MTRSTAAIDRIIGANIWARRMKIGLTQARLAELTGVSFQQIQKYEWGTNRLSVARFLDIAKVLGVRPETLWRH